jgi:hypothetical protein
LAIEATEAVADVLATAMIEFKIDNKKSTA